MSNLSSTLYPLLNLLADGEFHSGESIGKALGVSRAAVWKQLQKIEEFGLKVESIKGKGYRLRDIASFLDADLILQRLKEIDQGLTPGVVDVHWQIDSTNAELLRCLQAQSAGSRDLVLAEMQSSGRGRRGRQWVSPLARNIYASLAWTFESGVGSLDGLSLVVGVSLVEALKKCGVDDLQLKWPNDILCGASKVAGILLEISGDPTGVCHVVIGFGVNVNMRESVAGQSIDQSWRSLAQINDQTFDRNLLVAQMYAELLVNLTQFGQEGFAPFAARWQQLDAFENKDVVVLQGERRTMGVAKGVNDKGELVVETESGPKEFNGGEVSLRRVMPDLI